MDTRYVSKVDALLALVLMGAPTIMIAAGVALLERTVAGGSAQILAGVTVGALIALYAIPCHYTLSVDALRIRCGLIDETVPLASIKDVKAERNWWSAPALSIDRIKITTEGGTHLISPRDKKAFLQDLAARRSSLISGTSLPGR